jgi:multiple sugar transport system substrate-binding protein
MAKKRKVRSISRRDFLKAAGVGALAAGLGANIIIPGRSLGGKKNLKILGGEKSYVPSYQKWLDFYVREWGEKNDTEVTFDYERRILTSRAFAEIKAQKGHDLFWYPRPVAPFEEYVIDHREIYQECEKRYGKAVSLAVKSTYNPLTSKHSGFLLNYVPTLINYRKDLWDSVGIFPNTWEDIRVGGAKIKKQFGIPVGIPISKMGLMDSLTFTRAILNSYGASVQDEEGKVVLNSKQTLAVVKFVCALFKEAMTPEVLNWKMSSNNLSMLTGRGSLTLNPISITRYAEYKEEFASMSKKIWLAKPPAGPVRRLTPSNFIDKYFIWKFADNIEGAKQFLVDYVGHSREAFLTSGFYHLPCFPDVVPDLKERIANDPKAYPPDKYKVLADAQEWTTNLGYPGFGNAAIGEIISRQVIIEMFAKAATGKLSPEEAINEAEAKCKDIFAVWREKGLL